MNKAKQTNFILLLSKDPSIAHVTSLIYKSLPEDLSEDTPLSERSENTQWYFLRQFRFGLVLCCVLGWIFFFFFFWKGEREV